LFELLFQVVTEVDEARDVRPFALIGNAQRTIGSRFGIASPELKSLEIPELLRHLGAVDLASKHDEYPTLADPPGVIG
jgi:hypothetical protein